MTNTQSPIHAARATSHIHHGLASTMSMKVLPGEQADQFQLLLTDIVEEHQPRTSTESRLAESMALAKWRQMRAWEMGDAALTQEILDQDRKQPAIAAKCSAILAFAAFRELADTSRALITMDRYESRYERLYERSLKLLLKLKDERPQRERAPVRRQSSSQTTSADTEITEQSQEVADSNEPSPAALRPEASQPAHPGGKLIASKAHRPRRTSSLCALSSKPHEPPSTAPKIEQHSTRPGTAHSVRQTPPGSVEGDRLQIRHGRPGSPAAPGDASSISFRPEKDISAPVRQRIFCHRVKLVPELPRLLVLGPEWSPEPDDELKEYGELKEEARRVGNGQQ